MSSCRYIGASVIALGVEFNSVFLHTRKLLQMSRVSFYSPPYRVILVVNLVTFLSFRMTAITWITYMLVAASQRMSTAFIWALSFVMFITWIINGVLLYRLIKSDVLRKSPTRKKILSGDYSKKVAACDLKRIIGNINYDSLNSNSINNKNSSNEYSLKNRSANGSKKL